MLFTQANPFQNQTQPQQNPWGLPQMPYATVGGSPMDMQQMMSCMQTQLNLCTEYMRADLARRSESSATSPVRMRESDSHIYCELYLGQLTIGDVECEVVGNRIICRTRVPMMSSRSWYSAQMPRGFECFTLPDGRLEFCWVCPVAFQAKEIEACFSDNCLCICIPKSEAVATRQPVKVVATETFARVQ